MSNNKYFQCPANMSDTRANHVEYRGNGYNNLDFINNNNVKTSFEYRQLLQKNGLEIIKSKPFGCKDGNVPHGVINIDTNIMLIGVDSHLSYKSVFNNIMVAKKIVA